jgi:hypothetical protein
MAGRHQVDDVLCLPDLNWHFPEALLEASDILHVPNNQCQTLQTSGQVQLAV